MELFLVLFLSVLMAAGLSADMDGNMTEQDAMAMLKKYNYIDDGPDSMNFTDALMMFQEVAHINQTGVLDEETMEMMEAPRCGMPDIMGKGSLMKRRRKRYVLQGSRWAGGMLGYNYISYPSKGNLEPNLVEQTIDRAFSTWQNVAKLDFTKMSRRSDIEISFAPQDHGDGHLFDGPGGTLAHAFFPIKYADIQGDMHFDNDETWGIKNPNSGITDVYYVALHELGHSLGLSHSMVKDAIMYPYYPGYIPDLKLTGDDIKGIQAIYGARQPINTPVPPRYFTVGSTATWKDTFCRTGSVDAIGTLSGMLYAFQGELYAELDDQGIKEGFPRQISDDWDSLPSNVDAALAWEKYDMLLLFKGEDYWRYELGADSKPLLKSGPRKIKSDFTGDLPNKIDAAFVWPDNDRVYLISGQKYYRVRTGERVYVDRIHAKCDHWYYRYPKNFNKKWNIQLDNGVSEAVSYQGRTFFFSGMDYVRYNDNKYQIDEGYPKAVSGPWFGCGSGSSERLEMEMDMMKKESQFEEINSMLMDSSAPSLVLPNICLFIISFLWVVL